MSIVPDGHRREIDWREPRLSLDRSNRDRPSMREGMSYAKTPGTISAGRCSRSRPGCYTRSPGIPENRSRPNRRPSDPSDRSRRHRCRWSSPDRSCAAPSHAQLRPAAFPSTPNAPPRLRPSRFCRRVPLRRWTTDPPSLRQPKRRRSIECLPTR